MHTHTHIHTHIDTYTHKNSHTSRGAQTHIHIVYTSLSELLRVILMCSCFLFRYPKLAAKQRESNTAGNDIFAKFSAYVKNTRPQNNAGVCACVCISH